MPARIREADSSGRNAWSDRLRKFPGQLPHLPLTPQTHWRDNPMLGDRGNSKYQLAWGESVNIVADCTVPEKILLAAFQLEQEGQSPFSAEALIVASWQKFPRTFGLKGYHDLYPDSNKVLSSIMGEKGLARRGWLSKMGQKLYALTREGKQLVQRLLHGGEPVAVAGTSTKLSRDQEKFLLSLFDMSAVEKYNEGRKPELTFADATRFWGINESMHGEALNARLNRVRAGLAEIDRLLGGNSTELTNGRSISPEDIAHLTDIHEYLQERFARHLSLLRNRVER